MTSSIQRPSRTLVLGFLWTVLLIPAEVHGTLAEVGAHNVQGVVSIDARHGDQAAHLEHSLVEIHARCATCLLTRKPDGLPNLPDTHTSFLPRGGMVVTLGPQDPVLQPDRHSAGRSPPLLSSQ